MREINANGNISDIIKSLEKKTSPFDIQEEVWFRGQPNYSDRLTPSLFRHEQKDGSKLFYNEAGMYEEFIRRYPDHSKSHKNIFEWLTLMQHYGLPTRLLDWTTNLLVALYFCCRENKNEDGAIFAFNPTSFLLKDYFFIDFLETLVFSKNEFHFYETIVKLADNKFDERTTINGIPISVLLESR